MPFEGGDRLADRRLNPANFSRCSGETALVDSRNEDPELVESERVEHPAAISSELIKIIIISYIVLMVSKGPCCDAV